MNVKVDAQNLIPDGVHNVISGRKKVYDKGEEKDNRTIKIKNKIKVEIMNPVNGSVDETYYFPTIKQVAERLPMFNYDTWRNIALGRSKTYQKFVRLDRLEGKDVKWNEF